MVGTLLSWRGWSLNNWQTHWGGEIALADRPVFTHVPEQAPVSEPFLELDGDPGYYAWLEIGERGRLRVRALRYDNRADVAAAGHGQTGWRTTFSSLSLQLELPGQVGLIAQSMDGRTYAGPKFSGVHAIDNDFQGHFVLLTQRSGRHRVSMRRDWFEIDDRDLSGIDPNGDDGRGWTLSYQFAPNDAWMLGLEWLEIDSRHPARVFEQAPVDLTERAWFFVLRWRH